MKKKIVSIICALIIIVSGGALLFKGATMSVEVSGSSMDPTLVNGESGYANTWINKDKLKRFDIIVFNREGSLKVKRIIGLPGERIKYVDGHLYVNDEIVEETFLESSAIACTCAPNYTVTYNICLDEITVSEDEYFVMGDNRYESYDSRAYGLINKDQVIAKLFYIVNKTTKEKRFFK